MREQLARRADIYVALPVEDKVGSAEGAVDACRLTMQPPPKCTTVISLWSAIERCLGRQRCPRWVIKLCVAGHWLARQLCPRGLTMRFAGRTHPSDKARKNG
jgi:hypothetical protein